MEVQNNNNFLTLAGASKLTGYHQDYLGYLCRLGKLNGFKIGRNWVIGKEDLNEFIKNYQNGINEFIDEKGAKIQVHVEKKPSIGETQESAGSLQNQAEIKQDLIGKDRLEYTVQDNIIYPQKFDYETEQIKAAASSVKLDNLKTQVLREPGRKS